MRGLDPRIHRFGGYTKRMDCRVKPGNDDKVPLQSARKRALGRPRRERPMTDSPDVTAVLAAHLDDPAVGWSLGTFGAIAEFSRDPNEPVMIERTQTGLTAVTERGAICLRPVSGLRLVALESTTRESCS